MLLTLVTCPRDMKSVTAPNVKYHLSLSDSDRLRLLLKISRLAFLAALGRLQAIVGGGGGG